VFIGAGQDLTVGVFYTVTVGISSGVAIGKLAGEDRLNFLSLFSLFSSIIFLKTR
jgi:hypothetical protein